MRGLHMGRRLEWCPEPESNRQGLAAGRFKFTAISMSTNDLADIPFRKRHKCTPFQPNKFKGSEVIAGHHLVKTLPVLGALRDAFCVSGSPPAIPQANLGSSGCACLFGCWHGQGPIPA